MSNSLKSRSTKKEFVPWAWRMGVSKDTHTPVYWIRGLGYFVAPKGVGVFLTCKGITVVTGRDHLGHGKSRALHQDDNEHNLRKIREMCEFVDRHGGLYSYPVHYGWLTNKPVINRKPGVGIELRLHATAGIVDQYPALWEGNKRAHKSQWLPMGTRQFKQIYLEYSKIKQDMVKLFKDRYKVTVDDVMVFHKACPELLPVE